MHTEEKSLLAVDVGGGTQDIFVYHAGLSPENCPKLVMPSSTRIVAQRIAQATSQRRSIFLFGELMGGGSCTRAAREHIAAGLSLYITPSAALTFNDDLERVEAMGGILTDDPPPDAVRIQMGDIDRAAIEMCLHAFGVDVPTQWAVAVQDHGFSPGKSNRQARFEWYRRFIDSGGHLEKLAFHDVPEFFTRMLAVKRLLPDALVMDTGTAAIFGALLDEAVSARRNEGLLVINVGNYHTMCAVIQKDRMVGLLEHHTGLLDSDGAIDLIERFRCGKLSNKEVLDGGGHGCYLPEEAKAGFGQRFITVTGPNRRMLTAHEFHEALPYGDVMLAGCFGLVEAGKLKGII